MEYEVSDKGWLWVKHASLALDEEDIAGLIMENFSEDLAAAKEDHLLLQVQDTEDDNFTNWVLVPQSQFEEIRASAKLLKPE